MDIKQNVSLRDHSTMRLGGNAAYLVEVKTRQEVEQAARWAKEKQLPVVMIGDGSNIIWSDAGFEGLVIVNRIMRYEKFEEDAENVYITIGGGENWDSVVERTVADGLSGIEALSLIPGTAGATPVQNVGAYGQEISETLVSVECFDNQTGQSTTIPNSDCGFAYRDSRFKSADKGRFFITGLTLHLRRGNPEPPFYDSVQSYFEEHGVKSYTPAVLRDAVIQIRRSKLPDPAQVANNGSFFGNPIIDESLLTDLLANYPNMSYWRLDNDKVKLSAAWLVEQAGFKAFHDQATGMATWPAQSLVFVNEHAKTTADLLAFKQKVVEKVSAMFEIKLTQEPELIGQASSVNA